MEGGEAEKNMGFSCTNLDTTGYDLYHQLIADHCHQKLVIVSSNDAEEMDFCSERLNILDYK